MAVGSGVGVAVGSGVGVNVGVRVTVCVAVDVAVGVGFASLPNPQALSKATRGRDKAATRIGMLCGRTAAVYGSAP